MWRLLEDIGNPENRNAGNGGDLVKHTVYLTVLDYLLQQAPWATGLRVRECHAGRGLYQIPTDDLRVPLLSCLYDPVNADVGIPLHDVERGSQTALNVWPRQRDTPQWYGGSAVVNAWRMSKAARGRHLLELYEKAPDTRAVLRAVFTELGLRAPAVTVRILPESDPFAMWRQPQHQTRRDRYRLVFEQLLVLPDSPQLILFWTWGRAFPVAVADIQGSSDPVPNGYQQVRQLLHSAKRRMIRVCWRWGLQFAMWILVPAAHLRPLEDVLRHRCNEVRDHLRDRGCRNRLSSPHIDVTVD